MAARSPRRLIVRLTCGPSPILAERTLVRPPPSGCRRAPRRSWSGSVRAARCRRCHHVRCLSRRRTGGVTDRGSCVPAGPARGDAEHHAGERRDGRLAPDRGRRPCVRIGCPVDPRSIDPRGRCRWFGGRHEAGPVAVGARPGRLRARHTVPAQLAPARQVRWRGPDRRRCRLPRRGTLVDPQRAHVREPALPGGHPAFWAGASRSRSSGRSTPSSSRRRWRGRCSRSSSRTTTGQVSGPC